MANVIPEVINNYNVYDGDGSSLVGVSGEVELPDFEAITDTIDAAGILGEFEDPVTGQFSSMTIKIPFSVLYADLFSVMDTTSTPQLTLRGSEQVMDQSTGETDYIPVKIVIRGKAKKTGLGKLARGKKGEPSVEMEILYIKIMLDNETLVELDKLNFRFVLNGTDMMSKIRSQC